MVDRRSMLAGAAALAAVPWLGRAAAKPASGAFPTDFLWGAATSGHQVEGNNVNADTWLAENVAGTDYAEPSLDAANSFALWPMDLDLIKRMGLNSYRFSLEWSRIEPEPGRFSIAMLDHYKAIIHGCRDLGLTPVVTFNHFTTPIWFAARGGWGHAAAPNLFARFCDRAARHLADEIGYATTLNEPNLAGKLQHLLPGDLLAADQRTMAAAARACGAAQFQAGNAIFIPNPGATQANLLRGHALGRAAIKAVRGTLPVGVSLAILDDQAVGPHSLRDKMRAYYYEAWLKAARGDDFLGIQNYERSVWTDSGKLPPPKGAVTNMMGAEVYPGSLAGVARYAYDVARVPIMVTEHGVGTDDDRIRAALIPAALTHLKRAMEDGVPVLGYIHWSLIDNFEWGFGYRFHYGLHKLNRQTFERVPKPSAAVYGAIARANSV